MVEIACTTVLPQIAKGQSCKIGRNVLTPTSACTGWVESEDRRESQDQGLVPEAYQEWLVLASCPRAALSLPGLFPRHCLEAQLGRRGL